MNWEVMKLEDMTFQDRPITYGVVKPGPEDDVNGVLFIRGGDIKESKIDTDNLRTITQQVSQSYKRTLLKGGELLVSLVGNPGEVGIVPDKLAGANIARQAGLVALRPEYNSRFIMYFLKSPKGKGALFQRTKGSVQQVINLSDLKTVLIPQPEKQTQTAIASILSAYDELIENNRRRIALLEESARLLYREWFVHLRFPGHETTETIKGVPKDWDLLPASEAILINPKTDWDKSKEIRSIPMAALSESQMVVDKSLYELREKPTSVKFKNGDTLFARITPCLENGKTGYVNFLNENEVACGSTEFIILRGNLVSEYVVYLLAREESFRQNAIVSMVGSSGRQRVQPSCFDKYSVFVPSVSIANLFDKTVSVLFDQIRVLDEKNDVLIKARDHLLPRLMDGRVAV